MNLIPDKAFEKAVEQIGEMTKEPVGNLLNPPTKVIGEALAGILKMTFLPFSLVGITAEHLLKRAEYFYSRIEANLEIIPIEKRCEPPLNIVGPALEAAKYHIEDDALCEMFATLVASAMNTDTRDATHPSFVEIIKQLSPLDAKVLMNYKNNGGQTKDVEIGHSFNRQHIVKNMSLKLCETDDILKSALIITNLIRCGILIKASYNQKANQNYLDDGEINALFKTVGEEQIKRYVWRENANKIDSAHFEKYGRNVFGVKTYELELTAFGKHFIDICIV